MSWKTRKDGRHFMERPRKKERYSRRSKSSLPSAGIKHNGSLTKLGYHLDATDETRHRALNESVEKYGYKKTIDKLAALEGVNKNHPTKHDRLKSDIKYLEQNHGGFTGGSNHPPRTGAVVSYDGRRYVLERRASNDDWFAVEFPNRDHTRQIPDSEVKGKVEYYR